MNRFGQKPTHRPNRWKLRGRALAMAPLFCLASWSLMADETTPDLQAILAATAIEPPRSVRFREERHNPMLKEPMVLTGTMEYLEPGKLRKRVEAPFQESYLVEPGQVSIEQDDETRVIRGQRGKFVSGFLGGIESVLAGDVESLQEQFEVEIEGTGDDWLLMLTPKSRRLSRHLQNLVVHGSAEQVDRIRIQLDEEFHVMHMIHDPASGAQ